MLRLMLVLVSLGLGLSAVALPASAATPGELTLTFRDSQGQVVARVHPSAFQFESGTGGLNLIPGSTGSGKLVVQLPARAVRRAGLSASPTLNARLATATLRIAETPLSVLKVELRGVSITAVEFLLVQSGTPQAKLTLHYTALTRS
jgi:hypothetical protein